MVIKNFERGYSYCLHLLGRLEYPRKQLELKLRQKQYPAEIVTQILDKLETEGYVSDKRYTEMFVHSKLTYDHYHPNLIKQKLYTKGVPRDIIDEVIEQETSSIDFTKEAEQLAEKRVKQVITKPAEKQVQLLSNFLIRKGYPVGLSFDVAKKIIGADMEKYNFEGEE